MSTYQRIKPVSSRAVFPALILLAVIAALPTTAAPEYPQDIECEGEYKGHLQGVCTNENDAIYWSFTTVMVKTDHAGEIIKKVPADNHHGDLCFYEGKVYVAVNLGQFNNPEGKADSWVYVYDPDSLEVVVKHHVPEVFHGAGGIGVRDGKFYVVGGLPKGVEENYVYEYDGDFTFIKKHTVKSGWTNVGIQSTTWHDGAWWFGCYGSPNVLLKTDKDFNMLGRYEFSASLGIVGIGPDLFLVAKGPKTKEKLCRGTLHHAKRDAETGLAFVKP